MDKHKIQSEGFRVSFWRNSLTPVTSVTKPKKKAVEDALLKCPGVHIKKGGEPDLVKIGEDGSEATLDVYEELESALKKVLVGNRDRTLKEFVEKYLSRVTDGKTQLRLLLEQSINARITARNKVESELNEIVKRFEGCQIWHKAIPRNLNEYRTKIERTFRRGKRKLNESGTADALKSKLEAVYEFYPFDIWFRELSDIETQVEDWSSRVNRMELDNRDQTSAARNIRKTIKSLKERRFPNALKNNKTVTQECQNCKTILEQMKNRADSAQEKMRTQKT